MKLQLVADERKSVAELRLAKHRSSLAALKAGEYFRVMACCGRAIEICGSQGWTAEAADSTFCVSRAFVGLRDFHSAARYLGLTASLRKSANSLPGEAEIEIAGQLILDIRSHLGREACEHHFLAGSTLSLADAASRLLAASHPGSAASMI